MLRVIRQVQPSWVVGENVLGLVNWSGGLVFHEVQADLEAEGYEVFPFVLPACGVNAPHRRDRVWFVAHANGRRNTRLQYELGKPQTIRQRWPNNEKDSYTNATNALCRRQSGSGRAKGQSNTKENGNRQEYRTFNDGGWPTESPVRRANDGIPAKLDSITFSDWAKQSIKAYGNAIVPQVAFQIFKSIAEYKSLQPG
jgi:DNA (cytosine-5)-methyltransferase 1